MNDRLKRVARRIGGVAALTSLAGCGGTQTDSPQADNDAATTAPPGSDGSSGDGSTDDGTGGDDASSDGTAGDGSNGDDSTGDGSSGTTTTVDCTAKREELEETNFELEGKIQQKQFKYDAVAIPRRGLTSLADQIEHGFEDDVMAAAESVATAARESVVHVTVLNDDEHSGATGTGWFVSETEILTNAHVVKDKFTMESADRTKITLLDGTEFEATVAATPPQTQPDMALLKAEQAGTPIELGTDTDLEHGQPLVQVGHPGSVGYWVPTLGQFVAREEWVMPDSMDYHDIKTTTPGISGVSGSPLLDLDGRAVGMTWGASPPWQRAPGDPPVVAPDVVYDNPLVEIGVAGHLGAESIRDYLEAWR